jgi:hypothetical protein
VRFMKSLDHAGIMDNTNPSTMLQRRAKPQGVTPWPLWSLLVALPVLTAFLGRNLPPWALMWALAFAIYGVCKLLSWWEWRSNPARPWLNIAYLFAWPGLGAREFLDPDGKIPRPNWQSWMAATLETGFGALVLWGFARCVPASQPLVAGWTAMVGLIFLLHFGTFHLLALGWQSFGVNAQPLMKMPILARSLADFWGNRWNAAFNRFAHDLLFRRFYRRVGLVGATMAVFLVSGLFHEAVISVPARAGYGLPTGYFLLQCAGVLYERSAIGRALGLRRDLAGRAFAIALATLPAFWLFHPAFVMRVILPFMKAIHAL